MIQIQDMTIKHLVELEKLHRSEFELPNLLTNPNYPVKKAILLDGRVVGGAYLHITTEASFILDETLSPLCKARIIKHLFPDLLGSVLAMGLDDSHVFVISEDSEGFCTLLSKHFNFVRCSGIPMYHQGRVR